MGVQLTSFFLEYFVAIESITCVYLHSDFIRSSYFLLSFFITNVLKTKLCAIIKKFSLVNAIES